MCACKHTSTALSGRPQHHHHSNTARQRLQFVAPQMRLGWPPAATWKRVRQSSAMLAHKWNHAAVHAHQVVELSRAAARAHQALRLQRSAWLARPLGPCASRLRAPASRWTVPRPPSDLTVVPLRCKAPMRDEDAAAHLGRWVTAGQVHQLAHVQRRSHIDAEYDRHMEPLIHPIDALSFCPMCCRSC